MKVCAASMIRRRSKLSAKTPAASEKTMIGRVIDVWTSATMLSEAESEVIIQAAPTDCTRPPKFDASVAIQSMRNVWLRKIASVGSEFAICGAFRGPARPRDARALRPAWQRRRTAGQKRQARAGP